MKLRLMVVALFLALTGGPTAAQTATRDQQVSLTVDRIPGIIALVSDTSMRGLIQSLEGFGTRMASQPNRFTVANWILGRFLAAGIADVRLDSFDVGGAWQVNVVATLWGNVAPDREIVIGAHYDSQSWDPARAPGADDNASGTAAVIEMARALRASRYTPSATLRFIAFAAEEQGLLGSEHYVASALAEGRQIAAMQNYDMIGHRLAYQPDRDVRVVWYEGASELATLDSAMKRQYTSLTPVMTTEYRSQSDSWPFAYRGIKAVFNIEADFSPAYHTPDDRSAILEPAYAAEITKSGLALLLTLDQRESKAYPDLASLPDSLDFGTTFIAYPETLMVRIKNENGPDPLVISSISVSSPMLSVIPSTATLPRDSVVTLRIVFAPTAAVQLNATMQITSNDASTPNRSIFVTGHGLEPPVLSLMTTGLNVSLASGDTSTSEFTVANTGGSDLVISVNTRGSTAILDPPMRRLSETPEKTAEDMWSDETVSVTPTASRTNQASAGVFETQRRVWRAVEQPRILALDLNTSEGTRALDVVGMTYAVARPNELAQINLSDYDVLYIGWTESASGEALRTLAGRREQLRDYLTSGGGIVALSEFSYSPEAWSWLPFHVGWQENHTDGVIVTEPDHPVMAGLSSDLLSRWGLSLHNVFTDYPSDLRAIAVEAGSLRAVTLVGEIGGGRVVLTGQDPDWHLLNRSTLPAGVLIRNALRWAGQGAGWLRFASRTITIPAGSSAPVRLTQDASRLRGGSYSVDVVLASNDPVRPDAAVPVAMRVTDAPGISLEASMLDFGEQFLGYPDTVRFRMRNKGSQDLLIFSAAVQPAAYRVRPAFAGLDPGDEEIFTIVFLPDSVRAYPGVLRFTTNDPTDGAVEVALSGVGIKPPIMNVAGDTLHISVRSGMSTTSSLAIANTGESDLRFVVHGGHSSANRALEFNGTSGYVRVPATSFSYNALTLEAWVLPKDLSVIREVIDNSDADFQLEIWPGSMGTHAVMFDAANYDSRLVTDPLVILLDQWVHLAATYDGSTTAIYVNGELKAQGTYSGSVSRPSTTIHIGTETNASEQFWSGTIDEVRLWSVARSQAEIQGSMVRPLLGTEPGLLAYWNFDEGVGTVAMDRATHAIHGTLQGGVEWTPNAAPLTPGWLFLNPDTGSCAPHSSINVQIVADATRLEIGEYLASITIKSNDPNQATMTIPVRLTVTTPTGVADEVLLPREYGLHHNYPNPFNPTTQIAYDLPQRSDVTIRVYDLLGKVVGTVVDEQRHAGRHVATWNASNLPSGIYFCRMTAGSFTQTRKLVLMK